MPGVDFIFASIERPVNGQEIEELAKSTYSAIEKLPFPDEALFVDLRPAFSVPLSDVTPKTMIGVPMGWNPPSP